MRSLTLGEVARQGDLRDLFPGPVLVVAITTAAGMKVDTPSSGIRLDPDFTGVGDRTLTANDGYRVGKTPAPRHDPRRPPAPIGPTSLVLPVVKTDRNPFAGVITVGRAANNDIIIPSVEVSKVHAWIKGEPGQLLISDNGSTNGTVLDDLRLVPKVDYTLRSGATLRMGTIECRFLEPAELLEVCAAL